VSFPDLLQQTINGLSLGAMYALLALGFTLVYGILELINFAHFNVFMVSSFIGMWTLQFMGALVIRSASPLPISRRECGQLRLLHPPSTYQTPWC
jgi:branched-chain amino acid transport system permease protein